MLQNTLDTKEKSKLYPQTLLTFRNCLIEPAFKALLAMHPDFNLLLLNIVNCENILRNLLHFCKRLDKDFRFDVDLIKNIVFFIRKKSSPTVLISNICGYGHTFPEAHIIWEPEIKGSASH
jgi:hypothetical protein